MPVDGETCLSRNFRNSSRLRSAKAGLCRVHSQKISDGAGPGTLRQALAAANANQGGTIRFANGLAGTILLTGGELRITANVTISGPGADTLTISGNNASRVFTIESPPGGGSNEVRISGLTITGGFAGDGAAPPGKGGGIYVQGNALTLSGVAIANNVVVGPLGGIGEGGGLYANAGAVTISDSTISGNQVVGSDSVTVNGVARGGGLAVDGERLTLDRNIFAGNQAASLRNAVQLCRNPHRVLGAQSAVD